MNATLSGQGDDRMILAEALLRSHCEALLQQLGVSATDAARTVDVFLQAELMGEESHGLRLFLKVAQRVKAGGDRSATAIDTIMERGAVALWDGNRSLGQVTAARAMEAAVAKARDHGIGLVTVRNSNSLTSARYYPMLAAARGMSGATFTNTSRKLMPPPGGITPTLGNNPVAYAAPAGRYGTYVLDMACTAAAVEKIVQAKERGEELPPGWALDVDGNETRDPARALESMSLLPFGGYKAFNLAFVHELLTSVMSAGELLAGDATGFEPYDRPMHTSFTMLAVDISAFRPLPAFEADVESMIDRVKASRLSPGSIGIFFAGERSVAERERRLKQGIPVSRQVIQGLSDLLGGNGLPRIPG